MQSTFASASDVIALANFYTSNNETSVFNDMVLKSSLKQ